MTMRSSWFSTKPTCLSLLVRRPGRLMVAHGLLLLPALPTSLWCIPGLERNMGWQRLSGSGEPLLCREKSDFASPALRFCPDIFTFLLVKPSSVNAMQATITIPYAHSRLCHPARARLLLCGQDTLYLPAGAVLRASILASPLFCPHLRAIHGGRTFGAIGDELFRGISGASPGAGV